MKNNATIINGDMDEELADIEDESVDMIFTDPPYSIVHGMENGRSLIDSYSIKAGRKDQGESTIVTGSGVGIADDLYDKLLVHAERILKPGACICCCCSGGGTGKHPGSMQMADWMLKMSLALVFKQAVVWDKGPMGIGIHYRRSYELILVGMKGKQKTACNWYDETKRIENVIRHVPRISRAPNLFGRHPTFKPPGLSAHFINIHSKPGDLIVDPFCGSGTTGYAAVNMGREFIGIEIEEKWADIARNACTAKWDYDEEEFLDYAIMVRRMKDIYKNTSKKQMLLFEEGSKS